MKLKPILGIVLLGFMSVSLWNKFQESLRDAEEPIAMGTLIVLVILFLVVLVIRVLRD